jgi:hypothetical protein
MNPERKCTCLSTTTNYLCVWGWGWGGMMPAGFGAAHACLDSLCNGNNINYHVISRVNLD